MRKKQRCLLGDGESLLCLWSQLIFCTSASRTKAFRQWVSVCSLHPPLQRLLSVCHCAGKTCLFSDTAVSTESICGFKRHDELSPMKASHCSPADFSGCPLTWCKPEFLETRSQAEDSSPHLQIPVEVCVSHLSFWGKIYTPNIPCPLPRLHYLARAAHRVQGKMCSLDYSKGKLKRCKWMARWKYVQDKVQEEEAGLLCLPQKATQRIP